MLLDNLLETSIVQLGKLGEVVHVGNDVAQVFLEQQEVLLGGLLVAILGIKAAQDFADLLLRGLDAADNLLALNLLEGVDLIELLL